MHVLKLRALHYPKACSPGAVVLSTVLRGFGSIYGLNSEIISFYHIACYISFNRASKPFHYSSDTSARISVWGLQLYCSQTTDLRLLQVELSLRLTKECQEF
jgi:hypothetical protein